MFLTMQSRHTSAGMNHRTAKKYPSLNEADVMNVAGFEKAQILSRLKTAGGKARLRFLILSLLK